MTARINQNALSVCTDVGTFQPAGLSPRETRCSAVRSCHVTSNAYARRRSQSRDRSLQVSVVTKKLRCTNLFQICVGNYEMAGEILLAC